MSIERPDWLANQTSPLIRSASLEGTVDVGRKKALTFGAGFNVVANPSNDENIVTVVTGDFGVPPTAGVGIGVSGYTVSLNVTGSGGISLERFVQLVAFDVVHGLFFFLLAPRDCEVETTLPWVTLVIYRRQSVRNYRFVLRFWAWSRRAGSPRGNRG